MPKIIFVLVLSTLVLSFISCSPQPRKKRTGVETEGEEVINANNQYCPVTGQKIREESAATYDYQGKRYRMCCISCVIAFRRDPGKYIKIVEEGSYPEPSR